MKTDNRRLNTYLAHSEASALDEAGGRFSSPDRRPTVVGASPTIEYPQMERGPWKDNPYPDEPLIEGDSDRLGYRVDGGPDPDANTSAQATEPVKRKPSIRRI